MVELASSDELFKHPLHPYTEALLSAIPKPDPLYEKNRIRKVYDPSKTHDYSVDKPSFREVLPGHFVLCNDAEEAAYKAKAEELDKKQEEAQ
jgi:oligopeptide transport system ATP-binding protein